LLGVKAKSSPERELQEAIAFALLPKVGCGAFREGVERHGSAATAFRRMAKDTDKPEALAGAREVVEKATAKSISLIVQGEPTYPAELLDLPDPPCFIHALGDLSLLSRRRVGIVGTRHSSASGERIAYQLATLLVRAGAVVVSGMAFGIDAAAHRGALDAEGGTIAVLGGGVDVPYPPSHAALHERISRQGLVLSEAPIGTRPVRGAFPKRNRIIAALSEAIIVIEAGDRSGALITSRHALELGRTVAAVPGPIDSPRHVGSNRLLADGAAFLGRIEDVLSLTGLEHENVHEDVTADNQLPADQPHSEILGALRRGVSDVDDLARATRLGTRELATALSSLELSGHLLISPAGTVALTELR
jgi:DNA processing protein